MLGDRDRAKLREQIAAYSGLALTGQSDEALEQAVAQRLAAHGLSSLDAYRPLLQREEELGHLAQLLTNKETYFFREERHFRALAERLLPQLLAEGRRNLRLWSAGCATGEEAYSLAITLLEAQAQYGPFAFEVVGSDLDADALEKARRGCYGSRAVRRIPEPLRKKYFGKGPPFCLVPQVMERVHFVHHNLVGDEMPPELTEMDVIFCRNVTIYFDEAARDRLNARLAAALREGGYLVVASAETMGHNRGRLHLIPLGETFAFRKEPSPRRSITPPRPVLPAPPPPARTATPKVTALPGPPPETKPDPTAILDRARRAFRRQEYDVVLRELDRLPPDPTYRGETDLLRAATLLQQSQLEKAEAICRKLLTRDPWLADAHFLLGQVHRQRGQAESAVQSFKQAIYLQPTHCASHFFLAETYRDLGEVHRARSEYENTLNILRHRPARPPARDLAGLDDEMVQRACIVNLERLG